MKNKLSFNWSLLDQAFVSGGNFLTIFLGAYFLEVSEHAKLSFVFLYLVALTLLNSAIYFAVTPLAVANHKSHKDYLGSLAGLNVGVSIILAILATFILKSTSSVVNWEMSWIEGLLIFVCFLSFLNLDFFRRAQYILSNTKSSGYVSLMVFFVRFGLIYLYQPHSFLEFLVVITTSIFIIVITKINWFLEISIFNKTYAMKHFLLSRWSVANVIMLWLVMHGLVAYTGHYLEAALMAVLVTLRSISNVFNVLLELLETYLPMKLIGLKSLRVEGVELIVKVAALGLMASFFIGGLIYIFAEEVLLISLGEQYSRYWFLLLLLWIGNSVFFLTRLFGVSSRVMVNPILEFKSTFIGFLVLCFCVLFFDLTRLHHIVAALVVIQVSIGAAQVLIRPLENTSRIN